MTFVILALVLALLLSATAATAGSPPPWYPPKRFDHAFNGKVYIVQKPWWYCLRAYACTPIPRPGERVCTIYSLRVGQSGIDRKGYRDLIRHEIGHCNGWPPDHPK